MFREIENAEFVLRKYVDQFVEELVVKNREGLYVISDSNELYDNIFSKHGHLVACI